MTGFVKKALTSHLTLLVILVLAAVLRLYNLPGSLQFQGDQGRDALIVSRIFMANDPVFIGPVTSVGNMYLGPFYYYFMLPFLWLSYPSPTGPAYAVAILGVLTVGLIYKLGREMVGRTAALIAAFLYSFSSVVVYHARFSWNPNLAPLVSLLMIYWTYKAWQKNSWYWVLVASSLAVLLQLHYLTLLAAAGSGVVWIWAVREKIKAKLSLKKMFKASVLGAAIVALTFVPLVLFDYKHDWLNVKAFQNLLVKEENFKHSANLSLEKQFSETVKETHGRAMHILFEITVGKHRKTNTFLLSLVAVTLILQLKKRRKSKGGNFFAGQVVIVSFLVTGILGTALYEHTIFDHYIAYLFPVTFLVFGIVIRELIKSSWGQVLSLAFVLFYLFYNLPQLPLANAGWTINDMNRTSQGIYQHLKDGDVYNIILLSESGDIDGQNYRYFLSTTDKPPVTTERRGEINALFIINEDRKIDDVTNSPIYEIAVWTDKTVDEVFEIEGGPEITVLRK